MHVSIQYSVDLRHMYKYIELDTYHNNEHMYNWEIERRNYYTDMEAYDG